MNYLELQKQNIQSLVKYISNDPAHQPHVLNGMLNGLKGFALDEALENYHHKLVGNNINMRLEEWK